MINRNIIALSSGLVAVGCMAVNGVAAANNPLEKAPIDYTILAPGSSTATDTHALTVPDTINGGFFEAPHFESVRSIIIHRL